MPGTTIGTQMNIGYPGTFSRNGDCIIEQKPVTSADASGPNFGNAVVLVQSATGGTWTDAAVAEAASHTPVMTQGANYCFAGVAVREVKTMTTYNVQPTASAVLGGYSPGQLCDVLVRGSVVVEIQNPQTTTIVAGGSVWLRLTSNLGTVIGAFEPANDAGHMLQLTNCYFTTGVTSTDANGNLVAEITIITRNVP